MCDAFCGGGTRGGQPPRKGRCSQSLAVRPLATKPTQRGPQTVAKSAKRTNQNANSKLSLAWKAEEIEGV